ncbi:hypothetical protein C8R46DRAFT_1096419 [Mycena filopes]|nr:hypothetical protein C8R46DRAFT_1096419 [Mycena filopes]
MNDPDTSRTENGLVITGPGPGAEERSRDPESKERFRQAEGAMSTPNLKEEMDQQMKVFKDEMEGKLNIMMKNLKEKMAANRKVVEQEVKEMGADLKAIKSADKALRAVLDANTLRDERPDRRTALARCKSILTEPQHAALSALLATNPQRKRKEGEDPDTDLHLFAPDGAYVSVADRRERLERLKASKLELEHRLAVRMGAPNQEGSTGMEEVDGPLAPCLCSPVPQAQARGESWSDIVFNSFGDKFLSVTTV